VILIDGQGEAAISTIPPFRPIADDNSGPVPGVAADEELAFSTAMNG